MLEQMGAAAKAASYKLALLSSREKNRVLEKIADYLESQSAEILRANEQDLAEARENGLSEAMLDRLALTPARLKGIADDVRQVCNLADPVGQVIDGGLLDSGLRLERRREDFGQTLGKWGVGDGPYFYWPIIGPRTTRDTFGWVVDSYMDPLWYFEGVPLRNSLVGVRFVDQRASLLPTDKIVDEAAFDKYTYIRDAYLQNRISEINDGNVPIEGRDDAECKLSRCY